MHEDASGTGRQGNGAAALRAERLKPSGADKGGVSGRSQHSGTSQTLRQSSQRGPETDQTKDECRRGHSLTVTSRLYTAV